MDTQEYYKYIDNPHLIYQNERAPKTVEELRARIEKGERWFQGLTLPNQDLSNFDFSNLNLCGADLHGSNLTGCNFCHAILHKAELNNCNFTDANLPGCDFSESNLSFTIFQEARVTDCNFTEAKLDRSEFVESELEASIFKDTWLFDSKFIRCDLTGVTYESCSIDYCKVYECSLYDTKLLDIDLKPFCNNVQNEVSNSYVDWKSVARSLSQPQLSNFLISTGMPELVSLYLIDSVKTLDPEMLFKLMQKVFISYGSPDADFARNLKSDLNRNGVQTWFFEDDAEFGQKLHQMMRQNIGKYDRVILICSEQSLTRNGVLNEIEQALAKEAREGGSSRILPLATDNFVFSEQFKYTDVGQELNDRVIGDFSNADNYEKNLLRLLSTLRINKPDSLGVYDDITPN
ncbi:toll/interleukin-1 receptor domain-containing protein [Vibrio sp. CCB-PB317]|uniref:toll/interleukin-1 receptor domain-containing protein n=1 Tax=Vibrio sp. CCB-PB317 TaxID=2929171 RepID=UPI001FACE00E|nr:toll/interleukin-1 receptor domain-containing protein [Vibrio sp. CCB-PB317]MCJ0884305.1 toll/interleukin-1 receptor domain-containing protein [Vibrio sp. CCB-PB317]